MGTKLICIDVTFWGKKVAFLGIHFELAQVSELAPLCYDRPGFSSVSSVQNSESTIPHSYKTQDQVCPSQWPIFLALLCLYTQLASASGLYIPGPLSQMTLLLACKSGFLSSFAKVISSKTFEGNLYKALHSFKTPCFLIPPLNYSKVNFIQLLFIAAKR